MQNVQPPLILMSKGTAVCFPQERVASAYFTTHPFPMPNTLSTAKQQHTCSAGASSLSRVSSRDLGTSASTMANSGTPAKVLWVHFAFIHLFVLPSHPCPSPKCAKTAQAKMRWPAVGDVYIVFQIQYSGM